MAKYASGKYAIGYCDRCGFESKLTEMKTESVAGNPVNNRVCRTCYDPDHPQNFLGKYPIDDPQALRNARPDPALAESREIPS
jgi:hypothetical protein